MVHARALRLPLVPVDDNELRSGAYWWFTRADKGLKMIPGDVRDTGVNYEADLVVLRPGAPSQHLDATFRVEAGKITSINLAPR